MDNTYSIEQLIKTFEEHHKEFQEDKTLVLINDDFSLPLALHAICKAIKDIQEKAC